jgi:hypothetical protein
MRAIARLQLKVSRPSETVSRKFIRTSMSAALRACQRVAMIDATAPDGTRLHLSAHSVSGYKGVFESAGRYQAQVRVGGKQKYIGIFPTKMEAAIAVARAWLSRTHATGDARP